MSKKIGDFIEKKRLEAIDKRDEEKRKSISLSIQKEEFNRKLTELVDGQLRRELNSIHRHNDNIEITEIERIVDKFPYIIKTEINLIIDQQVAQYFLTFSADLSNQNGISIIMKSSGYQKQIEKELLFENIIGINLEDYIVELLNEFED